MIVQREVFLNPVEPEFIAVRIAAGIESKLDFTFRRQDGSPYPTDIVGQLQIIGRSSSQRDYLTVAATDVVNGKGRVVIPAGLRFDPNGYQLRLTGTVDTEPRVLAYGVMTAVEGAGPQADPQDVIDNIPITLSRIVDAVLEVSIWHDTSKQSPYDLTSSTVEAVVLVNASGAILATFGVTVLDANTVQLTLPATTVAGLPDNCWWRLSISSVAGVRTLAEGSVTVLD